ncbi:hypothetical protein OG705_28785 [Streptomyces sp. NBC_00838]|uniref:hypothetical protein n=1 Tax=Streptomyces sp. NBC_00838 TaxID=2903680 RepID=UPI003868E197|nr:hypothetical protein OG705_28785 [Streptomyces sp. NBC_00838]
MKTLARGPHGADGGGAVGHQEKCDHLTVQLTNTGVLRATGKKVVFENLWLFDTAHGRITRAQLYADTAVVTNPAG